MAPGRKSEGSLSKEMIFIVFILSLVLLIPAISQAQSNYSETLTITTYYPSPYGVYRNLEVKRGLAVGDITQSSLGSMDNLTSGQLYINNSVILNTLSTTPANTSGKAGQVIYVNNTTSGERMLKFHDGMKWVNATYTGYPIGTCSGTQTCRPSDWISPTSCPSCGATYINSYTYSTHWCPPQCGNPGNLCSCPGATTSGTPCDASATTTQIGSGCHDFSVSGVAGSQVVCKQTDYFYICTK